MKENIMKIKWLMLSSALVCACQQSETKESSQDTTILAPGTQADTTQKIAAMIQAGQHPEAHADETLFVYVDSIPDIIHVADTQKVELDGSLIDNSFFKAQAFTQHLNRINLESKRVGNTAYDITGSVLQGLRPIFVKKAELDSVKLSGVK
jgi:hypothetical protein